MATFRDSEAAWGAPPTGAPDNQAIGRLWTAAPAEASDWPQTADGAERPYENHPRGNPPLEEVDLERGEEKLVRVLGW